MPFSQLNSHLAFCETRTEPCVKCGRRIQYRDIEQHARTDCTANTTTATVPSTTRTSATNGPIRNPISILFWLLLCVLFFLLTDDYSFVFVLSFCSPVPGTSAADLPPIEQLRLNDIPNRPAGLINSPLGDLPLSSSSWAAPRDPVLPSGTSLNCFPLESKIHIFAL